MCVYLHITDRHSQGARQIVGCLAMPDSGDSPERAAKRLKNNSMIGVEVESESNGGDDEASVPASTQAYAPKWRRTPARSVLHPMTWKEANEWKLQTHNPLRKQQDAEIHGSTRTGKHSDQATPELAHNVASHYNQRQDVGTEARKNSPIIGLKRFNNWVKSALINLYAPPESEDQKGIRILDLGCGKGGDLRKWDQQHVSEMVMLDIADVSIQHARSRYTESSLPWDAHFFVGDGFRTPLDQLVPQHLLRPMFDVVTMQFCLHYGWDTEENARTMLTNVAKWLRPGGIFIGTIPDEETLFGRLEETGDATALEFGNDEYKVEFDIRYAQGDMPFGNKYHFWLKDAVDNVPEYVVDWRMLESTASEVGLHLAYKARFDQILVDGYQNKHLRHLLRRMNVLDQSVTADGSVAPNVTPSLWEACTLYVGFAFQKDDF